MDAVKQMYHSTPLTLISDRIFTAFIELSHPTEINATHWFNHLIVTTVCFFVIFCFHRIVASHVQKQYFLCHVFVNSIITYLTFHGAVRALLHPESSTIPLTNGSGTSANSQLYICFCMAIHVYHPIFFRTGRMDWIHHTPVYILNVLLMGCLTSDVFELQAIIMTGIPGGLDYLLLVLEGEGAISRATYKSDSAYINNWFRAPVGFLSGYICLVGLLHQTSQQDTIVTNYQLFVFFFMGIHGMWNPPFFGRQTIEANIVDIINRFDMAGNSQDRKKAVSLGKVRALSGRSRFGDLATKLEATRTGLGDNSMKRSQSTPDFSKTKMKKNL